MGNSGKKASDNAAAAAGAAAMETQRVAGVEGRRITDLANNYAGQIQDNANKYTPQQLRALDESYASASNRLAQEEKLMSSIDPALMEASSQALKLLRGESASSLAPLQNQRAQQRQSLVNSLRAQGLGEGSSAAINALNKFDSESANLGNQAQQQQLGTLLGTSLQARPDLGRSQAGLSALAGSYGALGAQGAGAAQTAGALSLGGQQLASQWTVDNAGAKWTTQVLANQARAQQAANQQGMVAGGLGALIGAGAQYAMGGKKSEQPTGAAPAGGQTSGANYNLGSGYDYGQSPYQFWGAG